MVAGDESEESDRSKSGAGRGRSIFWTVAGVLVGVQVATGLLAVLLSAWFAYGRSLDLVANGIRLRLDVVAEEIEQRAGLTPGDTPGDLPDPLRRDLAQRFPDPLTIVTAGGEPVLVLGPEDGDPETGPAEEMPHPGGLDTLLATGDIVVEIDRREPGRSWALAPLYDPDGLLAGGVLVRPLTRSIARELAPTRKGFERAMVVVISISVLIALVLGGVFTARLVRPIRRITRQVEQIGAGSYETRIETGRSDELGRLATAVNAMASDVEVSFERLRAADALRRELVANVGHDLRTPLSILMGYLEEAQRHLSEQDEAAVRSRLDGAVRQGDYLQRLITDLFEISLLDRNEPPLHYEPVPLGELLTDAANGHRALFEKHGITFDVDLQPGLPVLRADGVRLLRLIDNLLVNARQHTPTGGRVGLCARAGDDGAEIVVQDTGVGMSPEELGRVFERYYRGSDARTHGVLGTGLGLPISRAIARAHGGDLTVRSARGGGTTFTVSLPLDHGDRRG